MLAGMPNTSILDDLYRFNSWANARLFTMCEGLTDSQLDEPREMGFGSLRNTLFHILTAEEVWFERWTNVPWRPFPFDAGGLPLAEIARRLHEVAAKRQKLIDQHRSDGWRQVCNYEDSKRNAYSNPLGELLLHVANHGTHHRAQALNFLKRFGRTTPGGLDYLFFRFARPNVKQEAATAESMRNYGLEVESGSSPATTWDADTIRKCFAYGDWANERLFNLLAPLDDSALDRPFDLGMSTIRKTVLHIADAEHWWLRNWTAGPTQFGKAPVTTSVGDLRDQWSKHIAERNRFVESLDADSSQRVVTALVGPMTVRIPIIESMLQLFGHGTHHRAQLINMMRHTNCSPPNCDYLFWFREAPQPA